MGIIWSRVRSRPDLLLHLGAARWFGQVDYRDRMSELYPMDKVRVNGRLGVNLCIWIAIC